MHICFLNMPIEYYSPESGGAISTIIMQTARDLIGRGHRVSVVTIMGEDETYSVGEVVPIVPAGRAQLSLVRRRVSQVRGRLNQWDWPYYEYYRAEYTRALAKLAPDAIILFNDLVSPRFIRRLLPNSRLIVWLQNEQGTNRRDIRDTIAATDHFLTCSAYIRDWTVRRYQAPPAKFTVAHSGVDLAAFVPRKDYAVAPNGLRTLFVGRIDPNKGPDIAADAVAELREAGTSVCLTVAGGLWFYGHGNEMANPYFRSLHEKMNRAGATYAGHVPRSGVPQIFRSHDVAFVLSRSNEPFGLVVLEAMASGCAVIASDRGGLPEACGGAAILLEPDDMAAVVNALRTFAADSDILRQYKERSLARAARASWSATAEIVEQTLAGVGRA